MTQQPGPLYEMNFVVAGEALAGFEEWFNGIIERSRHRDGIVDVRVFGSGPDAEGIASRSGQFQLHDDATLDELLDGYFAEIDGEVVAQFGDRVSVDARAWRADPVHEAPTGEKPVCLNCGTRLRGQYCGHCGQRSRSRLISIWELLREAFGDLLELDSRLWRTVLPLLTKPGQLTKDYLEGRRARYMPPFRTYLVLSVLFFVVAFFDPQDQLSLLFEPEPQPAAEEVAVAEPGDEAAADVQEEQLQRAREELQAAVDAGIAPPAALDNLDDLDDRGGIHLDFGEDAGEDSCQIDAEDWSQTPEWLQKRLTVERMQKVCERIRFDEGKTFIDLLLDNIPIALIVLLPLMALVLKSLYPLSRRYFVEHLLFFVHFHAFFFLILILEIVFARTVPLVPLPEVVPTLVLVTASFYVPVYLYNGMRRVYGQGRIITFIKYLVLVCAYAIGAALTLLGAVLFALLAV